MKNYKPFFKFLLVLFICGAIGGMIGLGLHIGESYVIELFNTIENFLLTQTLIIQMIVYSLFALFILILYFIAKIQIKHVNEESEEGEILFDKVDNLLGFLTPVISLDSILSLIFYGLSITGGNIGLFNTLLFLFNVFFCVLMTSLVIKLSKKLHPEKKGNPLDLNFDKEWLSSCDEAEKFVVYKAAYKCYQGMNLVFTVLVCLTMFLGVVIEIGILPITIIGIIWGSQMIIYSVYVFKFQKGQL